MFDYGDVLSCLPSSYSVVESLINDSSKCSPTLLTNACSKCSSSGYQKNRDELLESVNERLSESIISLREYIRYKRREDAFVYSSYQVQERSYDNAIRYYEEAILMTEDLLEQRRHPELADIYVAMALVLKKTSLYDDSLDALEEALEMYEDAMKCVDPESPKKRELILKSAQTLNNIGNVLLQKRDLNGATEKYNEALLITEQSIPSTEENSNIKSQWSKTLSIQWAASLNNLATVHFQRGNLNEAINLHNMALDMQMTHLGEDDITVADTLTKIGTVNLKAKLYDVALKSFRQVLKMRRHLLGKNHEAVADALNNIGLVHMMMGDDQLADNAFTRAMTVACNAYQNKNHLKIADIHANMGFLAEVRNETIKAIYNLDKARRIYKTNGLTDSHDCMIFVTRNATQNSSAANFCLSSLTLRGQPPPSL